MATTKIGLILLLCLSQSDIVVVSANNDVPIEVRTILDLAGENRIVGGQEATRNEFPGIVNLKITRNGRAEICGGNILNASWILTAAHCVSSLTGVTSINITAGDHNRNEWDYTEQSRNWKQRIPHPNYNPVTHANDIALVELASPFNINEFVRPIVLTNPNSTLSGQAIVAGWGRDRITGIATNELRKANVTIVSTTTCQYNHQVTIMANMVCASALNRGVCIGDSGGPMMVRSQTRSEFVLAAITSFGHVDRCGDEMYPDVFQRVSSHLQWIMSKVDNVQVDPNPPPTTTTRRTPTVGTIPTTSATTTTVRTTTSGNQGVDNGVERTSTSFMVQLVLSVLFLCRVLIP